MAETMQITEPIAIALHIPAIPVAPLTFKMSVAIRRVAMAMPETGLLLLPTKPTMREETVAKKKPNTTIMTAPSKLTGMAGMSHTSRVRTTIARNTTLMEMSFDVRSFAFSFEPAMLFTAPPKVFRISGRDFIRLIMPPAASAPAPI